MTSMRHLLLLLLAVQLSCGRYLEWSTSTDEQLIQESLKKSLNQLTVQQNIEASESDAKNIVCQTHLNNGLHIKLSFDLDQKRWECELYKSSVETLGISSEKCEPVGEATPSNDDGKTPFNNEDKEQEADDEAELDELSQRKQSENENLGEEHDDEADLDKELEKTKTDAERENNDDTVGTNNNQQSAPEEETDNEVAASTEAANNEDEAANNEQT